MQLTLHIRGAPTDLSLISDRKFTFLAEREGICLETGQDATLLHVSRVTLFSSRYLDRGV